MPIDLENFKAAYDRWVQESLPDYQAGKMEEIVKKYPMFGEPGNASRQRRIILDALAALKTMTEPGTIKELPYQWKRPDPA